MIPEFLKLSKFQNSISENISQCQTCEHQCKIAKGNRGICKTRKNIEGKIFTTVYGKIASISFNPIEKKPFFHFHPGTTAITVGTYGCNFDCFWCQNYDISKADPDTFDTKEYYISPEQLIELATKRGCEGTSISFNEPTLLFEYSLEVFKLAKVEGLYNTYVTNGYMTENVLKSLAESGLDALNIDIKGDKEFVKKYCKVDIEKVWRNAKLAKELGMHVEITTLIIPGLNSDPSTFEEMASRIYEELGKETPWHITKSYPAYKSTEHGVTINTPIVMLETAYEIGKAIGLDYVYVGNVPGHQYENTYCPNCGSLAIERFIFDTKKIHITKDGKCTKCKYDLSIIV
jgi:pyruvate formate lyase activating enzyme